MNNSSGIHFPACASGRLRRRKLEGFTLIEMSIIIVIIGIILAAGTLGWNAVTQGRRLAEAKTNLFEVRDCLLRRMFYNNTYPSYSGAAANSGDATETDATDNVDCVVGGVMDAPAQDVDTCLCATLDPWGHNVFMVEGVVDSPAGEPLSTGTKYVADNEAQGANATAPDRTGSIITDGNGNTVNYIVFVLISAGADGLLDDSSYRDLFDGGASPTTRANIVAQVAPMNTATPPNFDRATIPDYTVPWDVQGDDDIYLYMTAPELRTLMAD